MKIFIHQRSGFGVVEFIVGAVILGLIGGGIWYATNTQKKTVPVPASTTAVVRQTNQLIWHLSDNGWQASETPPDCPAQPMLKMPTDISRLTSILYPGQKRGGSYKPNGGFRLDGTSNAAVNVVAPIGGYVARGSHYIESGEVQYRFDIMNNCGVMYNVDHLNVISAKLKQLTESWPAPQVDNPQAQSIPNGPYIEAGETLATAVGFTKTKDTFFDFGVYDYRAPNTASQSSAYQAAHQQLKETAWYAVCWLDWMPSADAKIIRALPAGDYTNGKTSDYCL